jgi:hypothetical protein
VDDQAPGVQVSCGDVLTRSTTVGNDLVDCPGGLAAGSSNITIDLNGHTIDGVGVGAGVRNDGFDSVIVRSGTLQEFDQGVLLGPGGNSANDNGGWGIFAAAGNSDGGGNTARGNLQPEQCFGVSCR